MSVSRLTRGEVRFEVLVGYGISPFVHLFQIALSGGIPRGNCSYVGPKRHSQRTEVASQITRIWISMVQFPTSCQVDLKDLAQRGGLDRSNEIINSLRMEVATKCLKMGREQDDVRLIDLEGCVAAAT